MACGHDFVKIKESIQEFDENLFYGKLKSYLTENKTTYPVKVTKTIERTLSAVGARLRM